MGGELHIRLGQSPHHLNPAIQSGVVTGIPGAQIFAGLIRMDNAWRPSPYLARRWETAKDGLSLTLHLVRHARFHDGRPITSEDVAFSVLTVKRWHPFKSMLAPVSRVDTPDPHTAVIRLSTPHPAIMLAMSPVLLPILPKHIYGSVEAVKGHPANLKPVGSGPFILEEFSPDKIIRLRKNPQFFLPDRPRLDCICFSFSKNTEEGAIELEVGNTHLMSFYQDRHQLRQLRDLDHITVLEDAFKGVGGIQWLAFNLRKKPFNDVRVRQAIAYAVDRDFIVEKWFQKQTRVATGPISSSSPFYTRDVNLYPQDFKKANRLLDEAGYPRGKTGKRFSFRMTYIPDRSGNRQIMAEYFEQLFLRRLGVEVIIDPPRNFKSWARKIANWDFDATIDSVYNWGDPVIGVHRTYLSTNIRKGIIWSNTQGYSNPDADRLMEAAGTELDFGKRKILYKRFQQLIMEDLPLLPLYESPFAIAHHKQLAGIGESIWGLMTPMDGVFWKSPP
ncbi:MAG: ABC transporter substrate-binding protein [Desulfobacter sp.]|nr:MAG: ABC transporter substrate-binding protein [Desulfobacter sp.]